MPTDRNALATDPDVDAAAERLIELSRLPLEQQKAHVREWPELGWDGIAVARAWLAARADGWQPMATAPKDGYTFIAYSQDLRGCDLPPFVSLCAWHPDAGFCTDELREPTHWMKLPPPPSASIPLADATAEAVRA